MKNRFILGGILSLVIFISHTGIIAQQEQGLAETALQKEEAFPKVKEGKEIVEKMEEEAPEEKKAGLVTMDFEDADIRDVIKVIALASGLNMVIGKDVEAKVTISLKDVPWERALDVILRTYNFTYKKEENLIRIMTFEKVKQEERDIPLTTKIIYLNFADVSDIKTTVAKMLSERGSIEVDSRTNSMLITDIPTRVEEVEKIAKKLDTRTPQVLIEAMLVDVKLTKDDELGINWNIVHVDRHKPWKGKTIDTARSGSTITYNFIEQPSDMSTISGPAIRFGWLEKMGTFRLEGLIQAWAQDAKANILASPKIVTLDNQTAKIEIKSQVAYIQHTESTEGGAVESTQFKDVITSLEVTPHITKEGFIAMNVKPRQEFVEQFVNGQPQIGSRSAETNVLVEDGETIVIGGLRKVEDNATITKVPFLGDLPIIGHLFRKKDVQKVNTELIMFVTPHIIVHPVLTDEEIDRYQMLDDARADFLKKWEEERKKRLEKRKQQALAFEPEVITEKEVLPEEKEVIELPPLPVEEEKIEEENRGYIYSW